MHRNSYTQEIGVDSDTKVVPLPYAAALLAVLAVGIWYCAGALQTRADERHAAKKATAAATAAVKRPLASK